MLENSFIIVFQGIPIPPSENALYRNVPGVGRVKTSEYRQYEKRFLDWAREHFLEISKAKEIGAETLVDVDCSFFIDQKRLISQKGRPKKIDTSNRLKALHDCLARILELDDSYFWGASAVKYPVANEHDEQVVVRITRHNSVPPTWTHFQEV